MGRNSAERVPTLDATQVCVLLLLQKIAGPVTFTAVQVEDARRALETGSANVQVTRFADGSVLVERCA